MTTHGQMLTLGVGEETFAVPVTAVQEILALRPISRLPHAPEHLLGVIDVRGETVPVGDLCTILGMAPAADNEATRIIVLRLRRGAQDLVVALRADRVYEVVALDSVEPAHRPEGGLLRWRAQMVAGLGRRNGTFVTVLNPDAIFGDDDTVRSLSTKAA